MDPDLKEKFLTDFLTLGRNINVSQRSGWAGFYTLRIIVFRTAVTFNGKPAELVPVYYSIGASHYTHPTADTFFPVVLYKAGIFILDHGTCHTRMHTGSVLTMAALYSKVQVSVRFHKYTLTGPWYF
jgi:hypothetical protein